MLEWSRPYPLWLYGLLAIGVIALIVLARWLAISPRLRRWSLFVPRFAVLVTLLFILLNPVRRDELKLPAEPASVVCLVDCSRSMALDEPVTRIERVKQVLQEVDRLTAGPDRPRLQLYRFGGQLSSAPDVAALEPIEDASRLDAALERLPSRFSQDLPRGVFVFSDGTVGDSFPAGELAGTYKRLQIPLHVFPVGAQQVRGDIAIQDLIVPRRAEKGAKIPVRTVIRSQGFEGERIVVQVRPGDRPGSEPIASLPVTLSNGPQPVDLVVEVNPDLGELMLEVPPLEGEAIAHNNRVPFQLASTNRKIKVIYMEGTAGNEYRWLHDALLEDKDIMCLSLVADQQYVQRQRLQRVGDPYKGFPATREELLEYDCVICSDISLGAFTPEQLEWTAELVAQRGGGFAMVGGITSFGAGGWDQTVWDQLIPVDMSGGVRGQGYLFHQFKANVPPEAASHPIWRIVDDPAQNRVVLDQMPPFLGTNYMDRLKPAATALGYSATPLPGAGIMPVFACQSYGRGRTFAFAPDTTIEWGRFFESQWGVGDNRYFRRFWRNVVRWLTENSVGGNRRLLVETDRIIYRPGQSIEIRAQAFDASMNQTGEYQLVARFKMDDSEQAASPSAPAGGTSLVLSPGGKNYAGSIEARALPRGQRVASQAFAGLMARDLEVIAMDKGKEVAKATVRVQLLNDSRELLDPKPVPSNLEKLAQGTGGSVVASAGEIASLLKDLPNRQGDVVVTRTPVWDSGWLWLVLIVLLTIEWSLRRLAGFG